MGGLGCLLPTYEKESKQKKKTIPDMAFFKMSLIIKRTTSYWAF